MTRAATSVGASPSAAPSAAASAGPSASALAPGAGPAIEQSDALVIAANVVGLVTAHVLAGWGYRVRVLERAAAVGGLDRSFRNARGRTFDYGLHVLDDLRSELTTRLFESVVDHRVHRLERRRGIVLRGHVIPYNAPPRDWPDDLRALLPGDDLVDDLGAAPPTRAALARIYGQAFTDLIFDECLASYPADARHLALGVDEHRLMANIYPWFFPRAQRRRADTDASRRYQDDVRERPRELMVYPDEGGFGGFVEGFRRKLEERGVEVVTGASDLALDLDDRRSVTSVAAVGRRFAAARVYWCAPPGPLLQILGEAPRELSPDRFLLGSLQLREPVRTDYTEVIVGDPAHAMNRVSFPGKLARETDDLVQVEFAYPRAEEDGPPDAALWPRRWLESLRALGLVGPDNDLVDADLKAFPVLYNSFGVEGEPMPEVDFAPLIPATSNLRPVLPTIRKVNINTRVPQLVRFLAADLTAP